MEVDTSLIKGRMAEKGLTVRKISEFLEIHPATLYRKLHTGDFEMKEAQKLVEILDIKNPASVFFAQKSLD